MPYDEIEVTSCPACGSKRAHEYWKFDCRRNADYNPGFNPLKIWMYCDSCTHVFSRFRPRDVIAALAANPDPKYLETNPKTIVSVYSDTMVNIRRFAPYAVSMLDVGCGACEMALAARDFGFDVYAIDVRDEYVKNAVKYGITAAKSSFEDFSDPEKRSFDIISAGDVIEHMVDPNVFFEKAKKMLSPGGAIWLSTPLHDGAVSTVLGGSDAMKSVAEHLQYFSRRSLYGLINTHGFEVVDFRLSKHYFGCVEVICK